MWHHAIEHVWQTRQIGEVRKLINAQPGIMDEIIANAMAVWNRVISRLERGGGNIRSCYIKTTMGPAIKVVVIE